MNARELVQSIGDWYSNNPNRWLQDGAFRNLDGDELMDATDPTICQACLMAAAIMINKWPAATLSEQHKYRERMGAYKLLADRIIERGDKMLPITAVDHTAVVIAWNDHPERTVDDVIELCYEVGETNG